MEAELSGTRAAHNQSLYRSVNEQIKDLNEAFAEVTSLGSEWVCECADPSCTLRVTATLQEYDAVRADGRTFMVYPGHVYLEVERVVAENDNFTTVEKLDDAGRIAEELDPRAS